MSRDADLLVRVLLAPEQVLRLDASGWDLLIRQARAAQLLARMATAIDDAGLWSRIPAAPARHLRSALKAQSRQRQAVRLEVDCLQEALSGVGIPLVLLKGAAYEMAELPPARSRLYNDLDVLVPRERRHEAELALLMHGWATVPLDAYDERYYRRWMHELPPLRHRERQSVVDIHHNLVPDTARIHPDPQRLLAATEPCPGRADVHVLAPADLILHSVVHLFNDGEFDHGLRDLLDIDDLARHFLRADADWQALVERARELDLGRPLHHALRCLRRTLDTPVPDPALIALERDAGPARLRRSMDALFARGLRPDHASCSDRATALARWLLFVRGHYLRMPLHLLLPHLLRKAVARVRPREPA